MKTALHEQKGVDGLTKKNQQKSVDGARRSRADGNTLGPMKLHPGDERELCSIFRVREPPPKKVKNKRKECTA